MDLRRAATLLMLVAGTIIMVSGCGSSEVSEVQEPSVSSSEPNQAEGSQEKEEDTKQTIKGEITPPSTVDTNDSNKVTATVTNIVDGDTIDVRINGKEETIRLLLVDTPETAHPNKPVQKFGPEASAFAKAKLAGEKVQLEYDGPKRDQYGRLLAYVWIDGNMFNQMLLQQGLARYAYVYDPPYTYSKSLMKTQNQAKNQNKGIWSVEGYVTDEGFSGKEKHQKNTKVPSNPNSKLRYDPTGPDRDCSDFSTQPEAQVFYEAAGGPGADPHRLDGNDQDGLVCESL